MIFLIYLFLSNIIKSIIKKILDFYNSYYKTKLNKNRNIKIIGINMKINI